MGNHNFIPMSLSTKANYLHFNGFKLDIYISIIVQECFNIFMASLCTIIPYVCIVYTIYTTNKIFIQFFDSNRFYK